MTGAVGALHADLSRPKDLADYLLTRFPRLYLFLEKRRRWLNWDRRVYLSLVQSGNIVLDIGANVGGHTMLFSHLVGREGKVIAFEPVPENVAHLRATVARRCRFGNVEIRNLAVGNPRGVREEVMMAAPVEDLTQASLVVQRGGSWKDGAEVRSYSATLTSIDAELAATPLARADFVKIDVEGAELEVLKGAAKTITRFNPLIYAEVFADWTRSFSYTPWDLVEHLRSSGYSEARVIRGDAVTSLRLDRTEDIPDFSVSSNVLFFSDRHKALVSGFDGLFNVKRSPPR